MSASVTYLRLLLGIGFAKSLLELSELAAYQKD